MVNILLGQQSSYTKYPCFIYLRDSRARDDHWVKKGWPPRDSMRVGKANVINEALVASEKIFIPPLRIELGLRNPALTIEKLKPGIFDGPQICPLIKDPCFMHSMLGTKSAAWQLFILVTQNFLGNRKADNYQELVENMLFKFKDLGVKMSIKVQTLI